MTSLRDERLWIAIYDFDTSRNNDYRARIGVWDHERPPSRLEQWWQHGEVFNGRVTYCSVWPRRNEALQALHRMLPPGTQIEGT
jgi:hypothetical protein